MSSLCLLRLECIEVKNENGAFSVRSLARFFCFVLFCFFLFCFRLTLREKCCHASEMKNKKYGWIETKVNHTFGVYRWRHNRMCWDNGKVHKSVVEKFFFFEKSHIVDNQPQISAFRRAGCGWHWMGGRGCWNGGCESKYAPGGWRWGCDWCGNYFSWWWWL